MSYQENHPVNMSLFPDTIHLFSPPLHSRAGRCCCLLRCANASASDANDEALQPAVLSPETFAFALEFGHANLELLGRLLQRRLALLFLQPESGRSRGIAPALIFGRSERRIVNWSLAGGTAVCHLITCVGG